MRLPWTKIGKADKEATDLSNPTIDNVAPTMSIVLESKIAPTENATVEQDDSSTGNHESTQQPHDEFEKGQAVERTNSTATTSSAGEGGADDPSKYKQGLPLYLLTFGLALSTFVVALDNTIIATAIPRITTVFDSLNDVGWYGSSYLLTTTSLQPTFGKIYQYFNVKFTYLFALFIFEVGSVICGAAVNSTMLIVGRAVAGVGASALFSGGMTIVAYSVPLHRRPIYIGLLSSMFGISSVIGTSVTLLSDPQLMISRSYSRRCLHGPTYLALVLLHQPTHRRNRHDRRLLLLPESRAQRIKIDHQGENQANRSPRRWLPDCCHCLFASRVAGMSPPSPTPPTSASTLTPD